MEVLIGLEEVHGSGRAAYAFRLRWNRRRPKAVTTGARV